MHVKIMDAPNNGKESDCADCKFNLAQDDEEVRCKFLEMIGKSDPACEKFEKRG